VTNELTLKPGTNTLIDLLDRFNRKERFFLIAEALGRPTFEPDPAFLKKVGDEIGVSFPSPNHVYCFVDFHLDWLYAALVLSSVNLTDLHPNPVPCNVTGNQEDVDLLLAFEDGPITQVVMVEAKAASPWTVSQLLSKAQRLRRIFGEGGDSFPMVKPHFLLTSPKRSATLDAKLADLPRAIPQWMKPQGTLTWVPLEMSGNRIVITRCDAGGQPSKAGAFWRTK